MIIDLREVASGTTIESEVCVVGGGAAGITMALQFARQGIHCALLESGGDTFSPEIQSLFDIEEAGLPGSISCRLRFLGGATNHWGGLCAPMNRMDFTRRDWVPYSGWPIDFAQLRPWYDVAQSICGLGPYAYDAATLGAATSTATLDADKLTARFYQFSSPPLNFAAAYRDELARSPNVEVYLNANVTAFEANENACAVDAVTIRTPDGWRGEARARIFILACGGIENARLLLLSNEVQQEGLGNGADNVGRYFMQHPHVSDTQFLIGEPDTVQRLFRKFDHGATRAQRSIGPSPERQRRHRILNCSATVVALADLEPGTAAAQSILRDLKVGRWPGEFTARLWSVITDIDSVVSRAWHGPSLASVYLRSEQAPDPQSRITLSDRRDRLNQPVARVDWRLGRLDKRTTLMSALLIGEELGRLGLGRIRLPTWLTDDEFSWPDALWGGCHHMGTTRMAERRAEGVVNSDCLVHGLENLYVAGSSVFATSGYANPTLTIVALALRLAEHVSWRIDRRRRQGSARPGADPDNAEDCARIDE